MKIPELKIPDRFEQGKSMPEDPPYSRAYLYRTSGAEGLALVYPFPANRAMQYGNPQTVIDGIHLNLGDNQGLIEVENGVTISGRRYLYSIVKTLKKPNGVQYCLRMNIEYPECAMEIMSFFDETDTAGLRDSMVFELLRQQGTVKITENGLDGWCEDPYDPIYTRGVCMNCSERREYDDQFPQHPLSEMRRLAAELAELN